MQILAAAGLPVLGKQFPRNWEQTLEADREAVRPLCHDRAEANITVEGAGSEDAGGTDGDGTSGGAGQADDDGGGCGCTTSPVTPFSLAPLGMLAFARRGRRRGARR